ncbi:MAG TPA: AAA family ATPase, partial [Candidatus Paceibacterota bacterium]|nr:AAA family ATPase [Candidatus Paceibacterota bacterium]
MYLKSLELTGFKSFAKKAALEFASPITGIVGPNGSGKSNVAEAFRFVLGEQSIKSMRGRRTEDLIWNGSQTVPRANRASVKLTFDNVPGAGKGAGAGRLFDIDFDSVTLERIIHRDSSSEYLLNGSPVRLRDIVEMLAKAHIGSTGHHIISQGEADRILSVNARERKSMIEEALGLKVYHYKKEEGLKKLEKTDENIEKIKGLRREIQPHLVFLGKQVGKLEKAKELAEALKLSYKDYFARERAYLGSAAAKLREEERPLKERLEDLAEKLTKAQTTLAELDSGDMKSQDVLVLEKALSDLRTEKDELSRSVGRLEGELQALSREREREERRLRDDDERPVPVSRIRAHLERIEHALAAVASDAQVSALQKVLAGVREALAGFRAFLEEGAAESEALGEIEKSIEALEGKKQELEEKLRLLEKKESDAKDRYLKLQQEIEEDRTVGRDAERAVFALSSEAGTVRV